MYYANSTRGFYDRAIHGDDIPGDAVEISTEEYAALLQAQSAGKVIAANDNGYPFAVDPPPPTTEQLAALASRQRDALLRDAATRIAPLQDAVDLGVATPEEESALTAWKQYRVALNRIDQQADFPHVIDWPQPPA